MEELVNQENSKPLRDEKGRLLPGNSGNLNGRPKGKTLKEYKAEMFRTMSDEEKEEWLKTHNVSGETQWKMAEGQPKQESEHSFDEDAPLNVVIRKWD